MKSPEDLGPADRGAPAPRRGGGARPDPGHGVRREVRGAAARAAQGRRRHALALLPPAGRARRGRVRRSTGWPRWRLSGTARRARPLAVAVEVGLRERLDGGAGAADRRSGSRSAGSCPAMRAGSGPALAVLFEGWDASGKGGALKRLVEPLDPRHVRVAQYAAPTDTEKRHHFLWRFWPALPGLGGMTVFDRSWYGRVLVERVEEFATQEEWERAYPTIVGFERTFCDEGGMLVKFWMHVSPRGAAAPLREAPEQPAEELEDHRRRLAEPREAAALRAGRRGHARPHRPPARAVAPGRGRSRSASRA